MKKQELKEKMYNYKRLNIFSKKTGALLYEFERFDDNWLVSIYDGKLELERWLDEEQVLLNLLSMQRYCFVEPSISFAS